ncbi:MAG TPA: glycosyltransferase 87 family protein [Blastocatellia bacterium]|nr:glycosyltransferase 87 family protein [Blastocatellia bacterium]
MKDELSALARPLALIALGMATLLLYDHAAYLHRFPKSMFVYVTTFVAQFALYAAACRVVLGAVKASPVKEDRAKKRAAKQTGAILLAITALFGAVFRAQLVIEPPYLSTDLFRYIWDGRVQAAGINPYRYIPEQPELAHLRDREIYDLINRRDFAHTIYPPAAQAIFLASYLIRPSSLTGFKTAMSLFDGLAALAIALALMRVGLDPARVIIFAWNPLVVWESAHSGHIEAAAMAFLSLALTMWVYERYALTGVALALAVLVKLYPLLLLPVFLTMKPERASIEDDKTGREDKTGGPEQPRALFESRFRELAGRVSFRLLAAFVLTVIAAYLPYIGVGAGVLGYLPGYLKEEGFVETGSRYFLLGLVRLIAPLPAVVYSMAAALVLAVAGLWSLLKVKRTGVDVARTASLMIGLFLILSTPRFSWYMAWIIPFLCFAPRASWAYLTGASVLLYFLWLTGDYPNLPVWLGAIIYLPTLALLEAERRIGRQDVNLWARMRA